MERVRREPLGRLRVERGALAHAEAVLLVHHAPRRGPGTPPGPRSARGCPPPAGAGPLASAVEQLAPPRRGRGAGEQLQRAARRRAGVERAVVLLGERLGGRHQRGLGAVLDRAQHRVQRHHRLAGPTSPISSRCIGRSRRQVLVDLAHRRLLVARELERQRPAPAVHHHAARGERPRRAALAPRAPAPRHGELEQEQLLEGEPAARPALVVLAVREVHRRERRGRSGSPSPTRIPAGSGSGVSRKRPRASQTSERRRAGAQPSVAGCTGTRPTVWTGASPASRAARARSPRTHPPGAACRGAARSCLRELAGEPGLVEPDGDQRARSRRRRAPRRAFGGDFAWASTETVRTVTATVPSCPIASCAAGTSSRLLWRAGSARAARPQSRCPSASRPSTGAASSARPRIRPNRGGAPLGAQGLSGGEAAQHSGNDGL